MTIKDSKYNEIDKYKINSDLVKDILEQAAKINQEIILPLAKLEMKNHVFMKMELLDYIPSYKEAYKKIH